MVSSREDTGTRVKAIFPVWKASVPQEESVFPSEINLRSLLYLGLDSIVGLVGSGNRLDLFMMLHQDLVWWPSPAFANYIIFPFVSHLFPGLSLCPTSYLVF